MALVWNFATLMIVASMFVIAAVRHRSLPRQVPCHFGLDGRPDAWMGRGFIWFYPIFTLLFTAAMNFDEPEGAGADDLLLATMLLYMMVRTVAIAQHRARGLGRWFVFAVIGVVIAVIQINV
jgi:hypothetical protein